jgi:hypothetical protein
MVWASDLTVARPNTLTLRKMAADDLEDSIGVNAAGIGQEIIGHERALSSWRVIVESPSFSGVVLESPDPVWRPRIMAFAAAVFVSEEFANRELSNPMPGLNARIISSIDSGRSVVLSETELRHKNTYGGLCQVILYSTWRRGALTPQQTAQAEIEFAKSYVELYAGYQLERLLFEATDASDIEHAKCTKTWRIVSEFADFHARNAGTGWNRDRALALIERSDALSELGSVSAFLFDYRRPLLRFKSGDQELLAAALEGLTDHELADQLRLKAATIKKRWASVFDHVANVMPGLLPGSDNGADRRTRGPQKRHHLLAYLRRHPEELRPFIR